MFIISELIYTCKIYESEWINYPTDTRVWIYIESIFFFVWIAAGVVFIFVAHLLRFRSTVKLDFCLDEDTDIWNNRRIDDFLRYIKFDFFVATLNISYLLMEILVATGSFGNFE
jgi:hypothetical protein